MSNAKHMTSAYDMHHDGSLNLWNDAQQPRVSKTVPRTQLSIMRSRLQAATPTQRKTYGEDNLSFQASAIFKREEAIERAVNVLLAMTVVFVIAWLAISILTHDSEQVSRHSMMDISEMEPPVSTGFAPMAAVNFLPDVGDTIDLGQVVGAPTTMHSPVPPPSLEAIEAMEADDGMMPSGSVNGWDDPHSINQMDI